MTPLQWRMHIIDCLADIGSADYQAQAWFGKGEKISSFAEIYATLMDDFILPDFIESKSSEISDFQRAAARSFIHVLDEYAESAPDDADSRIIFSDPGWNSIREMARDLARLLQNT